MLQNEIMAPALPDGSDCPADVLIVEDDPIIAIDFEDRLLGIWREERAHGGLRWRRRWPRSQHVP